MLDMLLALLCDFQLHAGTWVYDVEWVCAQTRMCPRCGEKGSRVEHVVSGWKSDGSLEESGYCNRCGQLQTRAVWPPNSDRR